MSEFKKKLRQNIVEPANDIRRTAIITGIVTETNNTNKCKVNFQDKNGIIYKNKVVEIRMYGDAMWTPKVNDSVVIEQIDNKFTIISKNIKNWSEYKNKNALKSDVYSNLVIDSSPGYLW